MSNQQLEQNSFLFGPNGPFIADLHARFLDDPGSVDPSWQGFFREMDEDGRAVIEELRGASWAPKAAPPDGDGAAEEAAVDTAAAVAEGITAGAAITAADVRAATVDSIRALMLIRAYRVRGHLEADLDPLGVKPIEPHPELDPLSYGFTEEDFDRPIFINHVLGLETATLNQIVKA
ncbi:MAG: 2-oxoglutarate dehydrogenase E1 component, partial [Kiloniellales bacterium]